MATADSLRRRVSGLPQSRTMQAGQTMAMRGCSRRKARICLGVATKGLWHALQIGRFPCSSIKEHTLPLLSVQPLRRPVLRAAGASVNAATRVLGRSHVLVYIQGVRG